VLGVHARADPQAGARPRVRVQPVSGVARPGQHAAAGRDRPAARAAQRGHRPGAVEQRLGAVAGRRRRPEHRGEVDQLAGVGAGDVVQRALGRQVAAGAAARADEPGRAVVAVQPALRPVGRRDRLRVAQRADQRMAAVEQQVGTPVDRLGHELPVEDRAARQVARRAVGGADDEVAAVDPRERMGARRHRRQRLAVGDPIVAQRRCDVAAEAARVDRQHVHDPRPGGRAAVLRGEHGPAHGDAGGGERRRPRGGLGLRGEQPGAHPVDEPAGRRGERADLGVEPGGADLPGDVLGAGRHDGDVDRPAVARGEPPADDLRVGEARRQPVGGPRLVETARSERQPVGMRGGGSEEERGEGRGESSGHGSAR
jgi:hypothetical protein